jgi:hypothetical protein
MSVVGSLQIAWFRQNTSPYERIMVSVVVFDDDDDNDDDVVVVFLVWW